MVRDGGRSRPRRSLIVKRDPGFLRRVKERLPGRGLSRRIERLLPGGVDCFSRRKVLWAGIDRPLVMENAIGLC